MEGFILTVASEEQRRRSLQKKKKHEWRNLFVKLDDISARLIAFTTRSQFEVCWSVGLVGADISTPLPGEPSYGVDVDDAPYCFYVRETSVVKDCTHYFSAPDDLTKKAWVKALTQVARDGPRAPRFAVSQAENEFEFHARVVKYRPHVDGTHAEYMITCSCQVFSKMVARRLMKVWGLWRRFSEFDELHQALKKSMGPQLDGIELVKHKRDAFRGVLGRAFDLDFLEERRVLLDSMVTNVCKTKTAIDFFKHHSDPHLKAFFQFEDNCQDVVSSSMELRPSLRSSCADIRIAVVVHAQSGSTPTQSQWKSKQVKEYVTRKRASASAIAIVWHPRSITFPCIHCQRRRFRRWQEPIAGVSRHPSQWG
ncbi:hypothetical protein PHYPSEUDO_009627 [Phytophthora pseudosyringae]|uniref:PH domain-containing protein n=1 Tax=Phytophthora pseudosyringae TaxID=221518 RepID=A0A8T1WN61_9STRA|nr:hypothetical protein PHYPSEUDO_009627 [Phytophthora pseudosyringae]